MPTSAGVAARVVEATRQSILVMKLPWLEHELGSGTEGMLLEDGSFRNEVEIKDGWTNSEHC